MRKGVKKTLKKGLHKFIGQIECRLSKFATQAAIEEPAANAGLLIGLCVLLDFPKNPNVIIIIYYYDILFIKL